MTATPAYRRVETLAHVTPFGMGLWDSAAAQLVADGLRVRLFPLADVRLLPPIELRPNRRDVFAAPDLFPTRAIFDVPPGPARAARLDALEAAFWDGSPPDRFLIEVRDSRDRFIPFVLHVDPPPRGQLALPACAQTLAVTDTASPPLLPAYVPLFSTPARIPPAGTAVVRASLIDARTGGPARSALLVLRESGRILGRGLADEGGEVAVSFGYPEPSALPRWSPPGPPPPPQPLQHQTWDLDVAVFYTPPLPAYVPDPADGPRTPSGDASLHDLCDVIGQRRAAVMLAASPPVPLTVATLRYGEELVLGAGAELLIDPV